MSKTKNRILVLSVLFVLISVIVVFLLFWNGILLINNPDKEDYPIRGVDVSAYQGEIDWQILSRQDIDFAFIKATEGSSFTDKRFEYNHKEAIKTDLRIGAYHFFSFESSGKKQATHFINTVPKTDNMLPPVIDFEFYGDFANEPPEKEAVINELDIIIKMLYEHYGMQPIIYTGEREYSIYLQNRYVENPIWIRSVYSKAESQLPDGKAWTFWQYTNRERLDGYNGTEKYIDMNVFNGTKEEFYNFGK